MDHQARRAYLEMILLGMLITAQEKVGTKKYIAKQLQKFLSECPGAITSDEYTIAEQLKNAVVQDDDGHPAVVNAVNVKADWNEV